MRKFIIDTDTASDDSYALMLALLSKEVEVLGLTTVAGNVSLEQATKNALMTAEVCSSQVPVYKGSAKPLFRELFTAQSIHGEDGMGEMNLIHPITTPKEKNAVDFILDTVREYPDVSIEIVSLGPATNLALAILRDGNTMKRVKHIYSMGTAGFGKGNTTPVAEFNVYVDAESYKVLLSSGIPITIIGFDMCLGNAPLQKSEIDYLASLGGRQEFFAKCVTKLLQFNVDKGAGCYADLPDAVAMSAALWSDTVKKKVPAECYCCTIEAPAYGQVIIRPLGEDEAQSSCRNADVVSEFDGALFKKRMLNILVGKD